MENEAEFDEIEVVSKSQLKRDSQAIQDLGKRLVALSANNLARSPLDERVLEAIGRRGSEAEAREHRQR